MASVKINCPQCLGSGLTGVTTPLSVCSECNGIGTISVSDQSTLSAINVASATPLEDTVNAAAYTAGELEIIDEQDTDPDD